MKKFQTSLADKLAAAGLISANNVEETRREKAADAAKMVDAPRGSSDSRITEIPETFFARFSAAPPFHLLLTSSFRREARRVAAHDVALDSIFFGIQATLRGIR